MREDSPSISAAFPSRPLFHSGFERLQEATPEYLDIEIGSEMGGDSAAPRYITALVVSNYRENTLLVVGFSPARQSWLSIDSMGRESAPRERIESLIAEWDRRVIREALEDLEN